MTMLAKNINALGVVILGIAITIMSITSCDNGLGEPFRKDAELSLLEYMKTRATNGTDEFSIFLKVLESANRANPLGAYNPRNRNGYTVFAPTNEAFETFFENDLTYKNIDILLADKDFVQNLVDYHVVNGEVFSKDFSFGALSDSSLSGDYITIVFSNDLTSNATTYLVNGQSKVVQKDVDLSNGVMHVIDKVLEPNFYSALELIGPERNPDLSIFYGALIATGVDKLMGATREFNGEVIKNNYTLLVVPDSIYNKDSIFSVDDLVNRYGLNTPDIKNPLNGLYQLMAYHILSGVYYLNSFNQSVNNETGRISASLYTTYSFFQLSILSELKIAVNPGGRVLETVINNPGTTFADTIKIDYAEIDFLNSNKLSTNGPIHFLRNILEIESGGSASLDLHFRDNEPAIVDYYNRNRTNYGRSVIMYPNNLKQISFTGIDFIRYGLDDVFWDKDYILASGDFTLNIRTPNLSPGRYSLFTRYAEGGNYATVQFFVNGKRVGSVKDCSRVTGSGGQPSNTTVGDFYINEYGSQTITIDAYSPGLFKCYFIRLTPLK
jgi:uncharacterized surface protein with fasciclin (FAS1) repeats